MKQITMDFETYESELAAERKTGAEIVGNLHADLLIVIRIFREHAFTYEDQMRGLKILSDIMNKIERKDSRRES